MPRVATSSGVGLPFEISTDTPQFKSRTEPVQSSTFSHDELRKRVIVTEVNALGTALLELDVGAKPCHHGRGRVATNGGFQDLHVCGQFEPIRDGRLVIEFDARLVAGKQ